MIRHLFATVSCLTIAAAIAVSCYALFIVDFLIFGGGIDERLAFPVLLPATVVGGLVASLLVINYWLCLRSMGFVEKLLASVIGWLRWKWAMRRLSSYSFETRS